MAGQSPKKECFWRMEGPFEIDPYNYMIDHIIDTSPGQAVSAIYRR
jgi:hypothetical protein